MGDGRHLFNPRSVNRALTDGHCQNYWTETGPMNEVADCVEHNVDEVREDIVRMVSGLPVEADLTGYSVIEQEMNSRDEIPVIPPFQFFIADILISAAQFPYLIFRQSKLLLKGAVIHEIVLQEDLLETYPALAGREFAGVSEMLQATGDSFIFILDEWDSIFYENYITSEDKIHFMKFLKALLKDKPYVDLAYMTGVLNSLPASAG